MEGVLSEGVLSEGVLSKGVLSGGGFVRAPFNEYPVSTVKATFMESGVIHFLLLCQYLVF